VCDHEPLSALALRRVLRDAGFEVEVTSAAADGLHRVALRVPDAVIVELGLPDGDGANFCRRVRQWSEMPLIVLSAVDAEDEQVRALEAGADHYVLQPFAQRELVARLCAALRRAERADTEPRRAGRHPNRTRRRLPLRRRHTGGGRSAEPPRPARLVGDVRQVA
jgi:two-component system, OmpR family, KDP operon response regulator KdpE